MLKKISSFLMYDQKSSIALLVNCLYCLYFIQGWLMLAIMPVQQHSFYELIINKARGKSGPVIFLFFISFQFKYVCIEGKHNVFVG